LFRGGRKRQIERLAEYLAHEVPDDEAVIVGGDFNDWRGELGAELGALGLLDVSTRAAARADARRPRWHQRTRTFPALLPLMPLDRIYVRGFAAHAVGLGWGADWARLSDHAPLLVDLTPQPQGGPVVRAGAGARSAAHVS
ncbi:MAG: endonuclease/exonuclease/phosphatase family protein, partial [Betaproteobacteria bacterium]|nr:endonuclease/exonuclease/phosphatase family protein [Betaproteobacteria bacterium]